MSTTGIDGLINPLEDHVQKTPIGDSHGLKKWIPILAKFLSIQVVVQGLGFFAGLLLIHKLSKSDYAFFTFANSMQATLLLLADVGVGSALSATGGKVWQNYRRFGELIQTGLQTRKTLAIASTSVALPILVYILRHMGATWPTVAALSAAVLIGCWFRLTNDVLTIVPNLHAQIDRLQKLDLVAAIVRLIAIVGAYFVYINAAIAILIASATFGLQTRYLRKWAAEGADLSAPVNAEDCKTIFGVIRQQAPNTIYFCVQSQLTVFLLSIFGSTRTLAEAGALGRVSVLFVILGTVMSRIIMPRFARCQNRPRLIQIWWRVIGIYFLIAIGMVLMAIFIPGPFMWLLGKKYAYGAHDFSWVVLGSVVGLVGGVIYQMISTRAWMRGIWLSIPVTIGSQLMLFHFLDLGTIKGVTLLTVVPAIFAVVPFLYAAYKGFQSVPDSYEAHS
jgi:O-antigen/teichoic acid export membrane protein